ncbi:MAG: ribonuclease P protein component [Gammaproteobacteria bacterium]|nr:ribonuclease P protein component [Gammaproteobacteria bacterium]
MPRNTPVKHRAVNGFSRRVRLLSSNDFQKVFKQTGYRSVDPRLTVLARQNQLGYARLGLAISKRTIKTAVGRNRVKRLVRESFRQHQQSLAGLDIVVLSRNAAPYASNSELVLALQTHWQRTAKQQAKRLEKQ